MDSAIQKMNVEREQDKLAAWLSPPDPSINYNEALQQRQNDTGKWFIQCEEFNKWQSKRNSFLWLHGIPGCGKTILSSTIIEHLKSKANSKNLLYFYFTFRDTTKQSLENVLKTLIIQLYRNYQHVRKYLEKLYSQNRDHQPNLELLFSAFHSMVQEAGEVWIVLDALDECQTRKDSVTKGLLSWIRTQLTCQQSNIHMLVTSRPEQDIEAAFSELAGYRSIIPIQSDLVAEDIQHYIHTRVREHPGLKRWHSREDIQKEIKSTLVEKANGM